MAINIEDVMNRVLDMVEKKQKDMPSGLQMYNDAQTKAKWDAIDKANAARDSLSSQEKQSESKLTTEQYKTALKNQQDLYTADAKNQNAIDVARIRAGDDGTGTGSSLGGGGRRRTSDALEAAKIASDMFKAQQVAPGQQGTSYEDFHKKVLGSINPASKPQLDANGMVVKTPAASTEGMSGYGGPDETPAQRAERQALVPGHKNARMGISTPYGEAPSALTPNQWQQYADSKSPGMKYNGNQPGMINDQIAGFTKPDGTRFFANTGAARMQAGTAGITPEAVTAPVTPNTAQAFTTGGSPDAANRDVSNTRAPVSASSSKPGMLQRYTDTYNKFSSTPLGYGMGLQGINTLVQGAIGVNDAIVKNAVQPAIDYLTTPMPATSKTAPSPSSTSAPASRPFVDAVGPKPGAPNLFFPSTVAPVPSFAGANNAAQNLEAQTAPAPVRMPVAPQQGLMSRTISALGPNPEGSNIFNDPAADTSGARLRAANTQLENLMPGPKPKGFLNWVNDRSKRKKATDKAFINY